MFGHRDLQQWLRVGSWTLAGIVGLGALLDAISNAIAIVTPVLSVVGSVSLAILWVIAQSWIRFSSPSWRAHDGSHVKLRSLGAGATAAIAGAIVLLWVPRAVELNELRYVTFPSAVPLRGAAAPSGSLGIVDFEELLALAEAPASEQRKTTRFDREASNVHGTQREVTPEGRPSSDGTSEELIDAITLEFRMTCDLAAGAELPPSEVPWMPMGGDARLLGGPEDVRLPLESPVRFRPLDGNRIMVTNIFVARQSSYILGRPLSLLRSYEKLTIPIHTIVFGQSMTTLRSIEVSLRVNRGDALYGAWQYDVPFQPGIVFTVPLGSLSGMRPR